MFTWHLPLDCETLAQPCLFLQDNKVSIEPDAATGQKWQRFGEISVFSFIIELNAQHSRTEREPRHSQQPRDKTNTFQQQQENLALNNMLRNSFELLNELGTSPGEE